MTVEFTFDWDSSLAVITYLASRRVCELTKGKLFKLLFLADKYHLVRLGRVITGDKYWAVNHGPIPSNIKNRIDSLESGADGELCGHLSLDRSFTYPRISASTTVGVENLSQSELEALDHVIKHFGGMTFAELRALTHEMPAYEKAWAQRGDSQRHLMAFEDFFEEDENAVVGAKEEMIENSEIRRTFSAL